MPCILDHINSRIGRNGVLYWHLEISRLPEFQLLLGDRFRYRNVYIN